MQNYRAGPVGHVGTRGVPRGAGGRITGGREEEGDATRGPGSTSTHLNFGYSQGQCGRTTRPSFLSPLRHFLRIVFFSPCSRVRFSLSLFLACSTPLVPHGGIRTALSRHTVLEPTPFPVPSQKRFFPFFLARTNLRSCEIPISGDIRVIGRPANSVTGYRRGHVIIRTIN